MADVKCIVFDFDGVIADSNAVKSRAYFDIFQATGKSAKAIEEVLQAGGETDRYQNIRAIIQALEQAGLYEAKKAVDVLIEEYAEQYNLICEEYAATCPEITGVSRGLPLLAERFPLYINSATPQVPLVRIVQRRKLQPFFKAVLGRPRKKVENLEYIRAREGLTATQMLFVGDGQGDLDAARVFGCAFVGVCHATSHFTEQPVQSINRIDALVEMLAEA